MTRLARRAGAAVAAVGCIAVLAGCGVPIDRSPQVIARDEVPFGLLSPTPGVESGIDTNSRSHQVFLVQDTRLVGVSRGLVSPTVTELVAALLTGPTDEETARGLRSAVPAGTVLHSASRTGDTVTLDLSDQLLQVRGQEQTLAIAEIVFTATAAPSVRYVRLRLDGQPLQVPRGDGTLSDVVSRADYHDLTR
jgi:hypothetical protein